MRSRPWIWIVLCLLLAAGVWFLWSGNHPAAHSRTKPAALPKTATTARSAPTVAQAKPITILSTNNVRAAAAARARANQFRYRLSNTTRTLGELMNDRHAILLANALIDTRAALNLSIPKNLQAAGEPGAYIVQASGPINNAFRARLAAAGAQIVSYIPNNAYLVTLSASGANSLAAEGLPVIPYEPYYKLTPSLLAAVANNQPAGDLKVAAFPGTADATEAALQKLGVTIAAEETTPLGPLFTLQNVGDVAAVAQIPTMHIVEPFYRRVAANDLSRATVGVALDLQTPTNYLGLSGSNVVVEVNDSGIDATHPDFMTGGSPPVRVFGDSLQSLVDTDGHGTHVAGIIAGDGFESTTVSNVQGSIMGTNGFAATNQFRGMAPNATLYSVGGVEGGSDTNFITDQYLQEAPVLLTNALISNNSWNYDGDNAYDLAAASYDAAVRDALPQVTGSQPVLFVFSAGNDGNGDDTTDPGNGTADSIASPATAKNVITVGAIQEFRNITNQVTNAVGTVSTPWQADTSTSYRIAGFSSRGNVGINTEGTYGRFKPDVVAPGTSIVSTRATKWDINTYFYASPTNYNVQDFSLVVRADALGAGEFPLVPTNTVQVTIQLVPNADSPVPFPFLPIYFGLLSSSAYDYSTFNNQVSIPPDGGLTIPDILNSEAFYGFNYAISNITSEPISLDIIQDTITTNNPGNYFLVYSNLDQSIGTPADKPVNTGPGPYYRYETGTSMAAADASGVLADIQDYFTNTLQTVPSPALLKAMFINGARPTGNYDLQVANNINYEGWGLINLPNSLPAGVTNLQSLQNGAPCSEFFVDQSPTNALATGDSHTYTINVSTNAQQASLPLRITLVWTDPPGDPAAAIKLVNSLSLVVSNGDTSFGPLLFYGNDIGSGSIFNTPETTNTPAVVDSVNNVQNVFISPPLGTAYTITVSGLDVNVNAVTAQTNNVVQDFALVVACGEGEVTNAIQSVVDNGIVSNPTGDQDISFLGGTNVDAALLNQFVGASSPLLGTNTTPVGTATVLNTNGVAVPNGLPYAANAVITLGQTNQWHFYVITNPPGGASDVTNAAFVTFLPDTLAIPRMGVFADSTDNATRPEADIDLYVTTDSTLTNLNPVAISNCVYGTQVGISSAAGGVFNGASLSRGGTEFVVDIGSTPGQVYYVGVYSEDQMASEYDFLSIFTSTPFSQMQNGNQVVNGQLLPVNIPDGSPRHPGIAYIFGLAIYPITVGQVVVNDTIWHQNFGDLIGTLIHNDIRDVLNNHDELGNPPGPYSFLYDDSGSGNYPGSQSSDGPGSLQNFTGTQGIGPWRLTEEDTALTQTGTVLNYTLTLVPHKDLTKGITVTIQPGEWFYDYVDVPVGYTNLTVFATNVTTTPDLANPLELFVKLGSPPTAADTNDEVLLNNPGPLGPGNSISVGPPLTPGRYFVGIFNPSLTAQTVYIIATLSFSQSAISTVDYDSAGPVPILDDAVTSDSIFVPRTDTIQDFNVGLRVDHSRISDLVFHLISPDGTRYLLMENRGAETTNGCGVTVVSTNTIPVSHNGGNEAVTNSFNTGFSSGTISIAYNMFVLPDRMVVYDGATQIADTGLVSGTNTLILSYSGSPIITIVMNPGGNTNYPTTAWTYTVSATQAKYYYLAFTEDTNLTTTPIKFAPTPFVPGTSTNLAFADSFGEAAPDDYTIGLTFGTNWTVITNEVSVVDDPANDYDSDGNFLALASGVISNNLPTVAGQTYTLSFAYRGPGIVSLWRGEGNANDSIGNNNAAATPLVSYGPAEVGQGFQLDDTNAYVAAPASSTLNVGTENGFTLDGWINPADVNSVQHPIFEWNQGFAGGAIGTHMWIAHASGTLFGNMVQTSGASQQFWSAPNIIVTNQFQHAAMTYNRISGQALLYLNGSVVAQTAVGNVVLQTSYNFYIGKRPSDVPGDGTYGNFFDGTIDEASVYDRALSDSEINAIYQKGSAGKYDTNLITTSPALSLAEAQINLDGQAPVVINGNNTNWLVYSTTFTASQNGTPLVINGLEPGMLLDDFTLAPIPANLYYQPEQDMSALNGTSAYGDWTLEIQDDRAGDFGTLLSWQLEFTFANTNIPSTTPPITIITPGQPIYGTNGDPSGVTNSIDWYEVDVPANVIAATNRLISADAPESLLYSFNYPPTTNQPGDAVLIANSTGPAAAVLTPATSPALVPGGTYYLGVDGPVGTPYVIEVDFNSPEATFLPIGTPVTNTIPAGSIAYYSVTVPTNADFATNILLFATGPLNVWFNQTNLPVGANPPDYALLTGSTGGIGNPVLATNTTPPLVPGQTYFLAVQNPNSFAVTYGLVVNFHLLLPPGSFIYYQITVPTNADWATNILQFATGPVNLWFDPTNRPTGTNGGDVLLLPNGTYPSGTNGSYVLGTNPASPPYMVPGGTYWLGVQNTNSFTVNFGLEVDFHLVIPPAIPPIVISGIVATNLAGTNGYLLTWYAPTDDLFMVQWTGSLDSPVAWGTFTNVIAYTSLTPTNGIGFFEFFDDGSQTGGFGPARFYRLNLLIGLTGGVPQTNSVPAGGFWYYPINVPTNADAATNILLFATGPVNVWFNQGLPPTGTNAGDYLLLAGATNGLSVLSTTSAPTNIVPGGTYWLGVQNTNGFAVSFGLEVDFQLLPGTFIITLSNGVPYFNSNSGAGGATDYYLYPATTNAARLQFEVDNPSGDVTLAARFGLPVPGLTNFDYLSDNPYTNDELIVVLTNSTPVALTPGDWYLAVVNISGAPLTYSVMATEWATTGRPFNLTGVQYTPPVGTNSGDFCVTWTSLPGAYYYVQGVSDLAITNWTAVSPTIRATTNTTTYCVTLPSPFNFFRVAEGLVVNTNVPPPILSVTQTTNSFYLLQWHGPVTFSYQVQWTPSLSPATWSTVATNFTSNTGLFQFLDDGTLTATLGPTRFYRLLVLP